jgi:dUTP pyrophosphatase
MKVEPRSGLSLKGYDVGAGVIDSNYRGEIKLILRNLSNSTIQIKNNVPIAQLVMIKISNCKWKK